MDPIVSPAPAPAAPAPGASQGQPAPSAPAGESRFDSARRELKDSGTIGGSPAPTVTEPEVTLPPELAALNDGMSEPMTAEEIEEALSAEGDTPAAPVTGDVGEDELVSFMLPALAEGDTPLEIPVADAAAAARLETILQDADANRAEAAAMRAEFERGFAEHDQFLANLRAEPVDTIAQAIGDDKRLTEFALELMVSRPELQRAVLDRLGKFEEAPSELAVWQANQNALKDRRKQGASEFVEERQFSRNWNAKVQRTIHELIPATFDPETRAVAVRDAMADIQNAIRANDGYFFDPAEVPAKLAARVKLWGGTRRQQPKPAASPASGAAPAPAAAPSSPAAVKPAAGPTAAQVNAAARTPEAIRAAVLRRRAQKSVSGGGSGVPASADTVDFSKMGTAGQDGVFAHLRAKMGVRKG